VLPDLLHLVMAIERNPDGHHRSPMTFKSKSLREGCLGSRLEIVWWIRERDKKP
jgi:hypothetical protein